MIKMIMTMKMVITLTLMMRMGIPEHQDHFEVEDNHVQDHIHVPGNGDQVHHIDVGDNDDET